mmetsp:Transcript_9355/g.26077  ORF Transcript_9355/g.26077 Transcript_9355/m.26077 type:complete len:155 (+) Transcript_9355:895-1359(+)
MLRCHKVAQPRTRPATTGSASRFEVRPNSAPYENHPKKQHSSSAKDLLCQHPTRPDARWREKLQFRWFRARIRPRVQKKVDVNISKGTQWQRGARLSEDDGLSAHSALEAERTESKNRYPRRHGVLQQQLWQFSHHCERAGEVQGAREGRRFVV